MDHILIGAGTGNQDAAGYREDGSVVIPLAITGFQLCVDGDDVLIMLILH